MAEPKLVVCIFEYPPYASADEVELTKFKPVKDTVYTVRSEFVAIGWAGVEELFYKLDEIINPPVYDHFLKSIGEPSFAARMFREVRMAKHHASIEIDEIV